MEFNVKCEIREKLSKTGTRYKVLVVHVTEQTEKEIYLDSALEELVKIKYGKQVH